MQVSPPFVRGIVVLEQQTGARINAKYYASDLAGVPEKQLAFEKKLHAKAAASPTSPGEQDVVLVEGNVAVYTSGTDVVFFVVGSSAENELLLGTVLDALVSTLRNVLRDHLDKNTILDNLELLLLCVDEIVDAGSILETDSSVLARRVMLRNPDGSVGAPGVAGGSTGAGSSAAMVSGGPASLAELTLAGALNAARDHFVRLSRS